MFLYLCVKTELKADFRVKEKSQTEAGLRWDEDASMFELREEKAFILKRRHSNYDRVSHNVTDESNIQLQRQTQR